MPLSEDRGSPALQTYILCYYYEDLVGNDGDKSVDPRDDDDDGNNDDDDGGGYDGNDDDQIPWILSNVPFEN